MAILKEEIKGTKIINEVQSSNLVKTEYDTETKKLVVEFKNGMKYEIFRSRAEALKAPTKP